MRDQMKAVGLIRHLPVADPESLVDLVVPVPTLGDRDLLVAVHAVSVNPADAKRRSRGEKDEKPPLILGFDAVGVVVDVGPLCSLFAPGDAVYYAGTVDRPGTNSEWHCVDERLVGRKPQGITDAQAAALPLTVLTAWEALFDRLMISQDAQCNQGKTILIIGGAGGVGSMATQLASFYGMTVIATASRPRSIQWVQRNGATHILDHSRSLSDQLAAMGQQNVEYILCLNDTASHWDEMGKIIAPQGKICSIVEMDSPIHLSDWQTKSVTFVWEWMFTRAVYQTMDQQRQHEILNTVSNLVEAGVLQSTLTEVLRPINAATLRKAHARIELGHTIGKIVIERWTP